MTFSRIPVSIVRRLLEAGYEAYIVGGAVRDHLLGKEPKDYDITTSATPEEVRHVFGRRKCRLIGRRFRLALVFEGGCQYEVSTFRREPTLQERHMRPGDSGVMIWSDNEFGTFNDDVKRRDFTANALYYDVRHREIIDKVGGVQDLQARIVRCIGDPVKRFNEDPVRMLRALKLVGQHGFSLCDDVREAIRGNASLIQSASSARLTEELMKIMNCDSALGIFTACAENGFLRCFVPEFARIWDTDGGMLIRAMLKRHDECLGEDIDFYSQKSFAFAVMALPYMLGCMDMEDIVLRHQWNKGRQQCKSALQRFFKCFDIARDVELDVCDMAMMMPSLMYSEHLPRIVRNSPLYPYAYELFRMLTMSTGSMTDAFKRLPFPDDEQGGDKIDVSMAMVQDDVPQVLPHDAEKHLEVTEESALDAPFEGKPEVKKRRRRRKTSETHESDVSSQNAADSSAVEHKKVRHRRKKSSALPEDRAIVPMPEASSVDEKPVKKRRSKRKKAADGKCANGVNSDDDNAIDMKKIEEM